MVPFFISNRFSPGGTYPFFFSNRLRNFAFFFVPGVARASPISTRAKTVDLQGCGGVVQSAVCLRRVISPKSGTLSDI